MKEKAWGYRKCNRPEWLSCIDAWFYYEWSELWEGTQPDFHIKVGFLGLGTVDGSVMRTLEPAELQISQRPYVCINQDTNSANSLGVLQGIQEQVGSQGFTQSDTNWYEEWNLGLFRLFHPGKLRTNSLESPPSKRALKATRPRHCIQFFISCSSCTKPPGARVHRISANPRTKEDSGGFVCVEPHPDIVQNVIGKYGNF